MLGTRNGSTNGAALAVLATVALSVVLFFVFTLPNAKKAKDQPGPEPEVVVGGGGNSPALSADGGAETPADPDTGARATPDPDPAVDFTSSPEALMGEISKRLAAGDFDALDELLGEDAGGSEVLAAAFGPGGYGLAASEQPAEVGLIGNATRWALPVVQRLPAAETVAPQPEPEPVLDLDFDPEPAPDPEVDPDADGFGGLPEPPAAGAEGAPGEPGAAGAAPSAEAPVERVYFDLVQTVGADGKAAWSVDKVHFPPAIQDLIAAAGGSPLAARARSEQDALVLADGFITAVTRKDFVTALRDCAPRRVPEEKIAGLCIVFEEGQLTLRTERPLVATALGDDKAWVIAHVESPKFGQGTEFGLVMERAADGSGWHITEINFGKLLDSYVAASEAGKVPYTPIKSQPGAGELLVLYFEYDDETLLPRAKRQLEILAGILKADPGKALTITGHADALGPEDYNARLSATRAASVKEQLIAFGVPEPQVLTRGFGEAKPWKPNERPDGTDDPKARAYNRRAEILLDF